MVPPSTLVPMALRPPESAEDRFDIVLLIDEEVVLNLFQNLLCAARGRTGRRLDQRQQDTMVLADAGLPAFVQKASRKRSTACCPLISAVSNLRFH